MQDLIKIGELSKRLNVSTRTLRYYEEIGLISSLRKNGSDYRHYDLKMIAKINQILFLRKLTFSIKEIEELFGEDSAYKVSSILKSKLKSVVGEIHEQNNLAAVITKMINLIDLRANFSDNPKSIIENLYACERELLSNETNQLIEVSKNSNSIISGDVRIIRLHPMKIAYYVAKGSSPEDLAWSVMIDWVKENQLDQLSTTRYLGFNNPNPSKDSDTYGYEVWTTIVKDIEENTQVKSKVFNGGLYAVVNTNMFDIVQAWQQLYEHIRHSEEYMIGTHQWLEEHIIVDDGSWAGNMQVDLYCPIRKILPEER